MHLAVLFSSGGHGHTAEHQNLITKRKLLRGSYAAETPTLNLIGYLGFHALKGKLFMLVRKCCAPSALADKLILPALLLSYEPSNILRQK